MAVFHRPHGKRFRARAGGAGRRQARPPAGQSAALSPRGRFHHRATGPADRSAGRRSSPYRARRPILSGCAGGECVSTRTQGGAQGLRAAVDDLPEFLDVWNSHFGEPPCALTVVATKGLAPLESILEINIFGVRDGGKTKKEIIDHKASQHMRLGSAAVRAGDLLCLSGLYAANADGAIPQARSAAGLKYFGAPTHHDMQAVLTAA